MADLRESSKDEAGIKLFGKMIIFQNTKENEEEIKADRTEEKRPEKVIPCPRCKSMETKFCYFNNYNVNQPRHFCKGCQRYWTAGGNLRNVAVGAGRRKNKPACGGLNQFPESYLYGVADWTFTGGTEDFQRDFLMKRRRASQGHDY